MNTNPLAKRILCYGDSYTHGASPEGGPRFGPDKRWTGVLQDLLGDTFEVIEEGLYARTLNSDDLRPGREGKNGRNYLVPCLESHDPLDAVILFLGANELKERYHKTAKEIGDMLESDFVKTILGRDYDARDGHPELLIIAPPIIDTDNPATQPRYAGAHEKNLQLGAVFQLVVQRNGCHFLDAASVVTVGADGTHLDEENNRKLAHALAPVIKQMLK